jgi:Spy/CpxP family protein refolding chaperone
MRTSKWFILTAAAALAAGGLTRVTAEPAERQRPLRQAHAGFLERAKERLGLTDEQVSQIKAALSGERETLRAIITRLHDARLEAREAIHSSDATESSVREAAAKIGAVQSDLAVERLKLYRRISPILTEQQREKLKEFETQVDDFVDSTISGLGARWEAEAKK